MILNVMMINKFSNPFIRFVEHELDRKDVFYFTYGNEIPPDDIRSLDNLVYYNNIFIRYFVMLYHMYKNDRIVLHGLIDFKVVLLLFFNPWLLKKCYWLIMGIDLYSYELHRNKKSYRLREFFRSYVFKNIKYLVTSIDGDYERVKCWYLSKGERINIYAFPNSVFHPANIKSEIIDEKMNILVGNSADPSNNHEEIFEMLFNCCLDNVRIYIPLSYGDKEYTKLISKKAKEIFGNKVCILDCFMNLDDYNVILSRMDIAIFNHDRQQGLSIIRSLLGHGSKVYLKKNTSSFDMFNKLGVKVFDLNELNLNANFNEKEKNIEVITDFYSIKQLKLNLNRLFS
ncbi:TDP-N-acetylfucosamine:lipid II N-acetylfucosaminyltransferase [Photobacterium leiognathi]|uniref:TDP-N-acetylfucosamine:lipid II N-acetylfucosaminyltransferase n=1 Tax=Photobacterium leiognathi TaxID=553611 RepID=UPI002981E146|nr:TDP-N-acetylfucosamine:lipid II N-acetylfucosaminyltransferase [Photobacterium leiognathi]